MVEYDETVNKVICDSPKMANSINEACKFENMNMNQKINIYKYVYGLDHGKGKRKKKSKNKKK